MRRAYLQRGSVLLEAILILPTVCAALLLNLEWIRRTQYEVALHHAVFLFARHRALGEDFEESRQNARRFLVRALGKAAQRMAGPRAWEETRNRRFYSAKLLEVRFERFQKFQEGDRAKHHFQRTTECKFYFLQSR